MPCRDGGFTQELAEFDPEIQPAIRSLCIFFAQWTHNEEMHEEARDVCQLLLNVADVDGRNGCPLCQS